MLNWLLITTGAGLLMVALTIFSSPRPATPSAFDPIPPGEHFIKSRFQNADGTLTTTLKSRESGNEDVALGDEALSESLGLWLLYAEEKNDEELFAANVRVLDEHFWRDGWIYWKLAPAGGRPSTNALVDDLRIAEALYLAADRWGEPGYLERAGQIAASLVEKQLVDGIFTDFYDYRLGMASRVLTLSYLNVAVLKTMVDHGHIPAQVYRDSYDLIGGIPIRNGFFPFSYDVADQSFLFHDEVNLIDQVLLAYHRQRVGIPSETLWDFLKETFYRDGHLYGMYHRRTKARAADYESPAIYGLIILWALEIQDHQFAKDVHERMITMQNLAPESENFGGYVFSGDSHIFDNLVPLLAERKAYNAGLFP